MSNYSHLQKVEQSIEVMYKVRSLKERDYRFLKSLRDQLNEKISPLTYRQASRLDALWSKVCASPF